MVLWRYDDDDFLVLVLVEASLQGGGNNTAYSRSIDVTSTRSLNRLLILVLCTRSRSKSVPTKVLCVQKKQNKNKTIK
jgi:hypothetical protein